MVSFNYLNYDFSNPKNDLLNDQPSAAILFQAITRRSVTEQFDMENLEILGDCFLKLTISMSLYYRHPLATVGYLTREKTKEISNENLYRLAVENQLKTYLYTDKILFQGTDSNWLPPGYILPRKDSNPYTHQKTKRKAFADMIEALIGAFLISSNYMITMKFMQWLGLNVIPFEDHVMSLPPVIDERWENEISRIFHDEGFREIEMKLNYVFRKKEYLISAFTHSSKSKNYSYERYYIIEILLCIKFIRCRLEFLGDAFLDFLVIRHTFLNYERDLTPG